MGLQDTLVVTSPSSVHTWTSVPGGHGVLRPSSQGSRQDCGAVTSGGGGLV